MYFSLKKLKLYLYLYTLSFGNIIRQHQHYYVHDIVKLYFSVHPDNRKFIRLFKPATPDQQHSAFKIKIKLK